MKENIWISRKNEFDSDEVVVKVVTQREVASVVVTGAVIGQLVNQLSCFVRGFLGDSDVCKGASTMLVVDFCS